MTDAQCQKEYEEWGEANKVVNALYREHASLLSPSSPDERPAGNVTTRMITELGQRLRTAQESAATKQHAYIACVRPHARTAKRVSR
jgi:hypothetical protein